MNLGVFARQKRLTEESLPPQLESRPPSSLPAGATVFVSEPHGSGTNSNVLPFFIWFFTFFNVGGSSGCLHHWEKGERVPHNKRWEDVEE